MTLSPVEFRPAYFGRGRIDSDSRDIIAASSAGNWKELPREGNGSAEYTVDFVGDDGSLLSVIATKSAAELGEPEPWLAHNEAVVVEYRADPRSGEPKRLSLPTETGNIFWAQCADPSHEATAVQGLAKTWIGQSQSAPQKSLSERKRDQVAAYERIKGGASIHESRDEFRTRRAKRQTGTTLAMLGGMMTTIMAAAVQQSTSLVDKALLSANPHIAAGQEQAMTVTVGGLIAASLATTVIGLSKYLTHRKPPSGTVAYTSPQQSSKTTGGSAAKPA